MNQFKRAKQTSHQTESVTDLKTAGVVQPKEKILKQDTELSINKEENTPEKINAEKIQNLEQPAVSNSTQTIDPKQIADLPKTESPVPAMDRTADIAAAQTPKTEAAPDSIPAVQPEIIPQPAVYHEPSYVQTTYTQTQFISPQQTAQPVVQPQYSETTIASPEPVETKPAKSSKKSAPNMFTQKNESKSIRKSLVLRPSSVKIAENYCAKNGGSFNELIQILLDNFIEEYGL